MCSIVESIDEWQTMEDLRSRKTEEELAGPQILSISVVLQKMEKSSEKILQLADRENQIDLHNPSSLQISNAQHNQKSCYTCNIAENSVTFSW